MEAVPRLPMLSFSLKTSPEKTQFGPSLKRYIVAVYNDEPENYNSEIQELDFLRSHAVYPTTNVFGCQTLKKYYCQLHFLKSRFPMNEGQAAAVYFTWKDNYSNMQCTLGDIRFELMCIMYNIGAMHTQVGAKDNRTSAEGLKMACTHFQCAAWAFQTVKETYHGMVSAISSIEVVHFMQQVCLAQAQECILEKSMMDNRKATITAKVAVQVVDHYKRALALINFGDEESSFSNFVGSKQAKEWSKYLTFKVAYHKCIALLFQGQQAEEQQKMGERVAFYQAACEQLDEAQKLASNLKQYKDLAEAIAFTSDVVEGKRKAAKNENEFIYHEEVPEKNALQEVQGASLVKGIAFSVNDIEVSGPDIFARLVPMEAHEASSLYSEKKAQRLRQLGELVESKDQALAEFMSSLQLDVFTQMRQATGLSQELVDRAAALSAKPTATQDLVASMQKLSNSYHEVESMLNEIQEFLKEEEHNEEEYQKLMGKRPPSIIATDLAREAAKYREAHGKANESNQNLHKAMSSHILNLKILAQPLTELQKHIPSVELPNPNVDENVVKEIESLVSKVEEMRNQRAMLWTQFREAVHKDDITGVLVTRQADEPLDQLFQRELQKHDELANLIEQNIVAQENILKAFVDAYARSISTRRYLQDVISKRNSTVTALITSYDTYEDLVAKANKGIDFYSKLETNVSKLLQRIKSASKVQQEEREQMLLKNSTKEDTAPSTITGAPKLKDFLDTRKKGRQYPDTSPQYYPHNITDAQSWPPAVRPAPLGSEVNNDLVVHKQPEQTVNYVVDQNLADRFASLRTGPQFSSYTPPAAPVAGYNYPQATASPQPTTSANNKQAFTRTTDTYQPISSHTQNQQHPQYQAYQMGYVAQDSAVNMSGYSQAGQSAAQQNQGIYSTQVAQPSSAETYGQSGESAYQSMNYGQISQSNSYTQISQPYNYGQMQPQVSQSYVYQQDQASGQSYPQSYQVTPQISQSYSQSQVTQSQTYVPNQTQVSQSYGVGVMGPTQLTTQIGQSYSQTQLTQSQQVYNYGPSYDQVNQHNAYNYNQVGQPNSGDTYYPSGYGPVSTQVSEQNHTYPTEAFGSSEYATSVKPNTAAINQNSTYSSPIPDIRSSSSAVNNYIMSNGQNYPSYDSTGQYQYYYGNYGTYGYPSTDPQQQQQQSQQPVVATVTSKESNIDLLTGLDFTVSQAPLIPQQKINEDKPATKTETPKTPVMPTVPKEEVQTQKVDKVINRKPLANSEVKKLFLQEIDKYEKFVDVLTNRTLNGPTNLELKWKEIQDKQDFDKKAISVARCYPMKNRYPDILPYDHSRIELKGAKDDYINASYVKDVSYYSAPFIVTQAPLVSTIPDFWTMIKEQHVELIVSMLGESEIGSDIYWPNEKGRDLTFPGLIVSLISSTAKTHWIERLISMSVPEKRDSRVLMHMQFTSWPGSLFPTNPDGFVTFVAEVTGLFLQQRSTSHPVVVHCSSGIGRSGLVCLLVEAILEVSSNPAAVPDLVNLAIKLAACRKNILRDREHLKFAFEAFLLYMKQVIAQGQAKKILNEVGTPKSVESVAPPVEIKQELDDPLSSLDPFWASKRSGN